MSDNANARILAALESLQAGLNGVHTRLDKLQASQDGLGGASGPTPD